MTYPTLNPGQKTSVLNSTVKFIIESIYTCHTVPLNGCP